jgi:nucleoside-diphosphate-sugar epimerase
MKHVLVTGATGFIGNYVITELLKRGCRVTATSANAEKASSFPWFTSVQYIPFRLNDLDRSVNYVEFFGNPDKIIHLAWEGLPNYRADFHMQENLPRHKAFLHNLVSNGLKDITVTGTCFEYGMQEGCLREDMPAMPDNPYAQAKDELRKYLESLLLIVVY